MAIIEADGLLNSSETSMGQRRSQFEERNEMKMPDAEHIEAMAKVAGSYAQHEALMQFASILRRLSGQAKQFIEAIEPPDESGWDTHAPPHGGTKSKQPAEGMVSVPIDPNEEMMMAILNHGLGDPPDPAWVKMAKARWAYLLSKVPV